MKSEIKAALLAIGLLVLVGCTLTQSELRNKAEESKKVVIGGKLISPKRCALKIVIVAQAAKEDALNKVLWSVADEQSIPAETRRAMEANGLRAGVVTGDMPPEVRELLDARPPKGPEITTIVNPSGDPALVSLAGAAQ